ncbi:hypothetical protein [Virgibacillus salexigens]|uniref:Uncharacterized protein n=1 Tax=Virgibacillus kapii TaxID=1638645 RepID=A0ABQ2DYR4_9BACI|nr:hypothetical protein [Virgibacillus kapii]GGJ75277.1 hypothetical protein GCM10007111_41040 [Virgibacillus kapii]
MNKKELANKYAELLAAKDKATMHPDNKGYEWKYNLYQDAVLKTKLPKEKLAEIEKEGKSLYEQYEREQEEANQFKETYKNNVLNNLEGSKEEQDFKKAYKHKVLAFLDKEQDEKQETEVNKDKIDQQMAAFESKYGYEKVYALKKEVLDDIREMDLTPSQRERLKEVERDLEDERQIKLGKNKKKDAEVEMEM